MPKFRSVIIVTYGRSGSTLLQGILNSMPGFMVRGENYNLTEGLYIAWNRLQRVTAHKSPKTEQPSHPWYGSRAIDKDVFRTHIANMLRDMLVPPDQQNAVTCYGFKEVRYPTKSDRFIEFMKFLRMIMPDLAVIINTRELANVARSGWWAKRPEKNVIKLLSKNETNFAGYAEANPDHTFHIRYEDVCARNEKLQALHEFLGVPYVPEAIEAVLSVTHSNNTEELERKKARRAARTKD